jgi:hypothetical protein
VHDKAEAAAVQEMRRRRPSTPAAGVGPQLLQPPSAASLEEIVGGKVTGNLPCGARRRKTRDMGDTWTERVSIFTRIGPFFPSAKD